MLWPFDLFEREFGGRAATSGKILCRLLLTCLLVVAVPPAFAQPATEGDQNIRIVAPQFVPLQFSKDGEVRGYVADLAKLVIDRVAGEMALTTTGIEIVPWRRAMKIATESPNVIMFSLSRTKTREDKFIWVGEVSPYEVFFFGLRDRQIEDPGSLDDMHGRGYRVGVQTGSNTEELLRSRGFQHGHDFVTYSHYSHGIKMLFNHRFAMMPLTSFVARANTCRNGFDGDKIEPVLRITELSNPLWMVLSRGTAPNLAARFRAALVQLKRQGEDQRLRAAYLEDFERAACAEK